MRSLDYERQRWTTGRVLRGLSVGFSSKDPDTEASVTNQPAVFDITSMPARPESHRSRHHKPNVVCGKTEDPDRLDVHDDLAAVRRTSLKIKMDGRLLLARRQGFAGRDPKEQEQTKFTCD
jgi:hypothetical protein